MMRFIRSALVIARRDFTATVLSKTFLFFLLGPLFPLLFGGVFGGIGARVASAAREAGRRGRHRRQADFDAAVSGARAAGRRDRRRQRSCDSSVSRPSPIVAAQREAAARDQRSRRSKPC